MKNIAIIDADLIGVGNHRFPNLASMKLSAYHKNLGDNVVLKTNYEKLDYFDKVYISKVFINTEIPFEPEDKTLKKEDTVGEYYKTNPILSLPNVEYGGTGFFYDKAPWLPNEIEHIMPDYHLYDTYISELIEQGANPKSFDGYTKYSIGFTTRGCIRHCSFCVNKNFNKSSRHSFVGEWLDADRPYICCLDDNVLACADWFSIFRDLQSTNKRFQFKQGLDERLLTDSKCRELFTKSKWLGDYIFAFDNIKDQDLIKEKLDLVSGYTTKVLKFYTICGYNHENDVYDNDFWINDIIDAFKRIKILADYGCMPYITRHNNYLKSPYKGMYINLARWCNQPNMFKKKSYREFVEANNNLTKGESSTMKYTKDFVKDCPEIEEYFDFKFKPRKYMW